MLTKQQAKELCSVFSHGCDMVRFVTGEEPTDLPKPLYDAFFAMNAAWLSLYEIAKGEE